MRRTESFNWHFVTIGDRYMMGILACAGRCCVRDEEAAVSGRWRCAAINAVLLFECWRLLDAACECAAECDRLGKVKHWSTAAAQGDVWSK